MNGNRILLNVGVFALVVFMAASQVAAYDIVEFPICTDSNLQGYPAISGNIVVWGDWRNDNWDIYGYDLLNQTEFPICTDTNDQEEPAISGSIVVWQDDRNVNSDIYGYDLLTQTEFPICTDANFQFYPHISGSIVVWRDDRNVNSDIYGYDLLTQTEFPICTDTNGQNEPAISGNIVVWDDFRNGDYDIYGYDLFDHNEFPISEDTNHQTFPAISGNIVVWRDAGDVSIDIYGYDLVTNTEFPICTDTNGQEWPAISGSIVVWSDERNDIFGDIYGYDLLTQTEFPICTDTNWQDSPAISGNIVVWEDRRNGDWDIYGAYILSPAHDKCENAIPVEVNVPYYGSTAGSTGTDVSGCGVNDIYDVWHAFTAVDGNYTVSLCGSDYDTILSVFDGCPPDANELACNDDNDVCPNLRHSQLNASLTAGKTYYIRVSGYAFAMGNYVLKVTGPKCNTPIAGDVNNDCYVNFEDLALFALDWLYCTYSDDPSCGPCPYNCS
ncbi:MAG: hypothetical protein ACYS21_06805, partial [Planctomycetota bacterium]